MGTVGGNTLGRRSTRNALTTSSDQTAVCVIILCEVDTSSSRACLVDIGRLKAAMVAQIALSKEDLLNHVCCNMSGVLKDDLYGFVVGENLMDMRSTIEGLALRNLLSSATNTSDVSTNSATPARECVPVFAVSQKIMTQNNFIVLSIQVVSLEVEKVDVELKVTKKHQVGDLRQFFATVFGVYPHRQVFFFDLLGLNPLPDAISIRTLLQIQTENDPLFDDESWLKVTLFIRQSILYTVLFEANSQGTTVPARVREEKLSEWMDFLVAPPADVLQNRMETSFEGHDVDDIPAWKRESLEKFSWKELCTMCREFKLSQDFVQFTHSDAYVFHAICEKCLVQYIISKKTLMIACPVVECGANLDQREIRSVIPARLFQLYVNMDMQLYQMSVMDDSTEIYVENCPTTNCPGWRVRAKSENDSPFLCPSCEKYHCVNCDDTHDPGECPINQEPTSSSQQRGDTNITIPSKESGDTVSIFVAGWPIVAEKNSAPMGILIGEHIRLTQEMKFTEDAVFDALLTRLDKIESDILYLKKDEMKFSAVIHNDRDNNEIVSHKVTNPRWESSFMYKHRSQSIDRFYGFLHDAQFDDSPLNFWNTSKVERAYFHDNVRLRSAFENAQTILKNEYGVDKRGDAVWAYHGTSHDKVDMIFKGNFSLDTIKRTKHGRGIYFSEFPQVALHYTSTDKCPQRGQSKYRVIILCKVLPGNSRIGGCLQSVNKSTPACKCDSHLISEAGDGRGNIIVMFHTDRILPVYELHVTHRS